MQACVIIVYSEGPYSILKTRNIAVVTSETLQVGSFKSRFWSIGSTESDSSDPLH